VTIGVSAAVLVWLLAVHLQARAEDEGISVEGCARTIAMQDQECV
jgi:hypothetical protein